MKGADVVKQCADGTRVERARQAKRGALVGVSLLATLAALPAAAQQANASPGKNDAASQPSPEDRNSEIVVTGTSVRGLQAPVGAPVVVVDQADIAASGATSTVDLLAKIPQMSTFGTMPHGQSRATQSFSIPSLRSLNVGQPGDGTLFLFNGNRMVGGGFSTRPDPAVIPPDAINRVDVVLGGGSAIYGSDAVAGTVNFVLRRNLNGVELGGTIGMADHYTNTGVHGGVGKTWSTGNILLSFAFDRHSSLPGSARDYSTNNNTANGGTDFRSASCALPNATIGSTTYAYPGLVAGTRNLCDQSDFTDLFPKERRRTGLLSFNQQLTDSIEFSVDGYYSDRSDLFRSFPTTASGTIRSTNPFFIAPAAAPTATSESLAFTFQNAFGPSAKSVQDFTTWQVIPSLSWKPAGGWQLRATANIGYGDGRVHTDGINTTAYRAALAGTTTATALNPYNLLATNPAVLATIADFNQYDRRVHKMQQYRLAADGPLFDIAGGSVKAAVGYEHYHETQYSISAAGPFGHEVAFAKAVPASGGRHVNSVFGEIVVPFVGGANAGPLLRSLIVDLSARYDRYSDFGGTFNPKFAVNYSPFSGLNLKGDYSTAFIAPTLNSTTKPQVANITSTTSGTFIPPGGTANRPSVILQGGNLHLKPEKAKTFDIGLDWTPPAAPALQASLFYYHINFEDLVAGPTVDATFFSNPGNARFYILNPTVAQIDAIVGSAARSPNVAFDSFGAPQIFIDSRTTNLGSLRLSGLDYSLRYRFETPVGAITPGIAGTHGLVFKTSDGRGGYTDNYDNGYTRDTFEASLDYEGERLLGRVTLDYVGGYDIKGIANQTHVGSFKTVNLYLGYKIPGEGFLKNTSVSLHLDNVLDEKPSYLNTPGGVGNGSTVGRYISLGLKTSI